MLFTYPAKAIENNWIHECIQYALEKICDALDKNQIVPGWPEIIPEANRGVLANRRTLPKLLDSFTNEAGKLSSADRAEFLEGFRQQNLIPGLLDGSVAIPVFNQNLQPLLGAAKAVCDEGFSLLSKLDVRGEHYQLIYAHLKSKTCPFCGMEPFDAPALANEDEDHYLARSTYPLAAANFANLAPMGGKCNQRYKGQVDILHFNGGRRRALNPYGNIAADISLINSTPLDGGFGMPSWEIDLMPDVEEVRTWESVFSIRRRLTESVLNPHFDSWISELPIWFSHAKIDVNVDNETLMSALDDFVAYKTNYREQGAGFFKGKVFEFLAHHFRQGNEHVIAMIRSCLPKPVAA
ncbi:TPA: hypothetical protein ACPWEG_001383 [Pseudomonas aeruginosa]|nr:hypothetical protein [Pseudomonas aeruginosa]